MKPRQAIVELKANPRKWLENHYLITYAADPAEKFGPDHHYLGSRPKEEGSTSPRRTQGAQADYVGFKGKGTRAFTIRPNPHDVKLLSDFAQIDVVHVPVVRSDTLRGAYDELAIHSLAGMQGHDFMVTTLLVGCTFVVQGPGPFVRHVQPTDRSAVELRDRLKTYPYKFGAGIEYNHTTENATVIGVRRDGRWEIYAQVHKLEHGSTSVLRVVQIF